MSDWLRLFPDEDFRFRMGVRPGDATRFFEPSPDAVEIMRLRAAALTAWPDRYAAAESDALPLIAEAASQMALWSGAPPFALRSEPSALCIDVGKSIESDWVLLSPDAARQHPVVAGVVCFPSSWSLPAKLGQPMGEVHRPAPSVNSGLGRSIVTFLERLVPGQAWQRENWGLSADGSLDHHPDIAIPPLTESATLQKTWLRLESQLLVRLPQTRAILFGIRVTTYRLDALAAVDGVAPRIARALRTMPADVADYKGLTLCRETLARALG